MSSLNKKFKKTLIIFDDDDNNLDFDDDDNNMDCDEIHQEDCHGNYKNDNYNDDQEKDSDALDDCGMGCSDAPDDCGTGGSIGFPKLPDDDQSESEKLFMKKYEMLGKVGQGTYGKVYRGRERSTGKYVAIKIARIDNPREEGISSCTLREISNLKILNFCDEHIVKEKTCRGRVVVYLVFEYMDCDLLQVYRDHRYLKESMSPITIKSYMYQLLKGLEHSHNNGILHRDLKPSNLLVNETTGLLKIADWGLGRVVFGRKSTFSNIHGTLCYTAPEQLLGDPLHTFAIDVWAVGCIFGEMHTLKPLFEAKTEIELLLKIFNKLGTPNESTWAGVSKLKNWRDDFPLWNGTADLRESLQNLDDCGFDLLMKMLEYQPSKRISAKHALSHPYFAEYEESYDSHSESDSSQSNS